MRQSNRELNRIRGFSRDILELLNDCGGLSTIEIARKTGKTNYYVRRYLYNLRNYYLIALNKDNWKWYITATDDIIIYIIYNGESKVKERRKKEERKDLVSPLNKNGKIEEKQSIEPKEPEKKTIDEWKEESSQVYGSSTAPSTSKKTLEDWQKERNDMEVVVVSHLINHFNETMNKFVLCTSHDEFAEMLNIGFPESSQLPKTLLRLESDGVLYNYYVREKSCWKIGLKDAFIQKMQF